jgi:hypothetical protein
MGGAGGRGKGGGIQKIQDGKNSSWGLSLYTTVARDYIIYFLSHLGSPDVLEHSTTFYLTHT